MNFNIIDIVVVILLIIGFINGFRRGVIKQSVMTFGSILSIVLAFLLKNPLSIAMYKKFPFFTTGILKNYSVLNILLYELISFLILLAIFSLIYAILVKISGLFERILRGTIILAIPSKILGGILGIVESYIFCFIILLILSLPISYFSNSKTIANSKIRKVVLNNTVILSDMSKDITNSANDINKLLKDKDKLGSEEFNCKAIDVFFKNKIVSEESIDYLVKHKKINKTCTE